MDLKGEYRLAAPRETVWALLNDPDVLRACIPGCQSLEMTGDNQMAATVVAKVGPVKATFTGEVRLENIVAPESYSIVGEGKGGIAGFASGGADVHLAEDAGETVLTYSVNAKVGGKIAQLGARLVDSTAKQMADQFFDRFSAHFPPPETEAPPQPEAAAPVGATANGGGGVAQRARTNTDTEYLAHSEAAGPLTQHGADGPSASGRPVHRPNPRPVDTEALRPLRLLTTMQPFGFPLQFWIGGAAMVVIAALMFL